ncbi:hypothetical protein FIV42_14965 [Persicimonas caeni]|uniref:Peptidase C-terminal archaeal/bacterial domain-containing protein n=1 Tax=Persicimonas caeni TaxID=2292766 RepID=A0A4Y6PUJ5_PERCE|nr:hypothetical protein [Persicimonas caeni]QDG51992.1 hypothetical protein FIV42_14965 [Persicimonas caeni]QED33213.1 hypothetical protein FRD00_14960 [Persicimonas caeni]
MHFKRRLIGLLSCLAAAATLTACGGGEELTCGPGTQAMDGECALTDDGCADGTVLAEDGTCVPESGACAEGTTFDAEQGKCIVNTEITCGEGTVAQDGICVVETPTTCGPNTERDANSGECIITDAACTVGTAYDSDSDSCMPTDEVCAEGTHFSVDDAVCMPDAQCQEGDIILNGLCATHAEELAANADHAEAQPVSDPADITLKAAGEQYVFTGTIAAPADHDADGTLDQDADVYNFSADAGTWMEIALQSTGMPAPGFKLASADGTWVRYSPFDTSAARQIMIPKSGDYTLTILPSIVMQSDGAVGPLGGDDWGYVGTFEKIDAPTSVPQGDMLTNGVSGEFSTLTDNFFEITDLPQDGLVKVQFAELSDDIDAEVVVWGDAPNAFYNFPISASGEAFIKVPDASSVYVLVDYVRKRGSQDSFATGAATSLNAFALGSIPADSEASTPTTTVAGDDTLYVTFRASADQFLELTHDNANSQNGHLTLYRVDGSVAVPELNVGTYSSDFVSHRALYQYTTNPDAFYVLEVVSAYGNDMEDQSITVASKSPIDLGQVGIGSSVSHTGGAMRRKQKDWGFVEFPAETRLELASSVTSDEMFARITLEFWDDSGESMGTLSQTRQMVLMPGTYKFAVAPTGGDIADYNFDLTANLPPIREGAEPNDTPANATPMPIGRDLVGTLAGTDVDVWQVDLAQDMASDEVFVAEIAHTSGGSWIGTKPYGCKLLDSTGAELIATPETSEGCVIVTDGLTTGTYYIEVTNPTPDEHGYAGEVSIVAGTMLAESNDTTATATTTIFADLTSGDSFFGETPDATDVDYLEFTVNSAIATDKALIIYPMLYTESPGTIYWAIEDSMGNVVTSGPMQQGPLVVPSASLPTGTYYVGVAWPSPRAGQTGVYSFHAAVDTPPSGGK